MLVVEALRVEGLQALAELLDSISDADDDVDDLLDAYNEDRIAFDWLLDALRRLARSAADRTTRKSWRRRETGRGGAIVVGNCPLREAA